jgi:hypothetical protein
MKPEIGQAFLNKHSKRIWKVVKVYNNNYVDVEGSYKINEFYSCHFYKNLLNKLYFLYLGNNPNEKIIKVLYGS